ncbi:DWNN domain-containing protein [Ampelomyces quisqualis]|uniref:DWNN domain-containing protein n=1 Tax=Ampelomyces quisqualis TaxID=50730 RepID=A0A6A5QL50_AMPQU|nr:DWNN domain-containing protein [Ampelomyces quisqualis]
MSSSVFYKFKNSREPERIVFNGTGISVFELKREIIIASGLGDGSDFNLHIYPEDDLNSEYKDDTSLIPRSATVVCVRRPAPRGQGRAARYISGKAPVRAITKDTSKPSAPLASSAAAGGALTEADAEAAFLAESAQVWDAQKESLSHVKPTYNKNKKPVNVPNHDPPPGYVCRRCNIKGHWIQACPTNDDPDFKQVFQAKRTTGIPRSFLKTVEKPVDEEAAKGIMLNADGEYVQVMTDTKTWEKFQEKANASKAQAATADAASKEIRERGLECPIDKRRFVDPVKTPCCSKTYCRECIDNALADGDLICPNCGKEEVLMDDLVSDEDMVSSLRAYDAEKAKEKAEKEEKEKAETQAAVQATSTNEAISTEPESTMSVAAEDPTKSASPGAGAGSDSEASTTSKKRKEAPTDIMPPTAPKAMRQAKEQESRQVQNSATDIEQTFIQQMEALKNGQAPPLLPNMPNIPNMPMMPGMGMGFPMGPQMGFQQQQMGFNMPFNQQQQQFNPQMGFGGPMMPNMMQNGMQQNGYPQGNMQIPFHPGMQGNMQQNDAYERQPVNNRNRNRRARAPDYRYL